MFLLDYGKIEEKQLTFKFLSWVDFDWVESWSTITIYVPALYHDKPSIASIAGLACLDIMYGMAYNRNINKVIHTQNVTFKTL